MMSVTENKVSRNRKYLGYLATENKTLKETRLKDKADLYIV